MLNQLVRYEAVVDLLGRDGGRLADIGSGSVGIAAWVGPEWSVTAVDRDFTDYGTAAEPAGGASNRPERITADALRMPFDDGDFDAVVALDLIEHVGAGQRREAITEIARLARSVLIVGCPTGPDALEADRRLLERYRAAGIEAPGWLVEHIENGFPEPAELRSWLEPHGVVTLVANESVRAHERLSRFELTPRGVRRSVALTRPFRHLIRNGGAGRRVCSVLVRRALRGRDRPPAYRTIAVTRRRPQ